MGRLQTRITQLLDYNGNVLKLVTFDNHVLCVGEKETKKRSQEKETVTPSGWLSERHRKLRVASGLMVWFQGSLSQLKLSSFMRCQHKRHSISVPNLTCLLHWIFNLWYFGGLKCLNIKF